MGQMEPGSLAPTVHRASLDVIGEAWQLSPVIAVLSKFEHFAVLSTNFVCHQMVRRNDYIFLLHQTNEGQTDHDKWKCTLDVCWGLIRRQIGPVPNKIGSGPRKSLATHNIKCTDCEQADST